VPRTGACTGCCVRQLNCKACARCLPKYLCVDVVVTPGYADLICSSGCEIDDYGQGRFSFRLNYSCGGWSGSGSCGAGVTLDLSVTLAADCTSTSISSSLSADLETFEGVLPAGMSGSFTNSEGDIFDWEISRAKVVENPLAKDKCSPCSCAKCLPEKLCVAIQVQATDYEAAINETTSLLWDCASRSWTGSFPDGFAMVVALKSAASGVCGIDVTINSGWGVVKSTVALEGGLNSRKFHGTICKDSAGIESTEGIPELHPCPPDQECDDPPPQDFVSAIDATINITSDALIVGTVRVHDQSCGNCPPPCPPILQPCCDGTSLPARLHVSDGTTTIGLLRDVVTGQWSGGGNPLCGIPDFGVSVTFECEPTSPKRWKLIIAPVALPTNYVVYPETISCDPFEAEASLGDCLLTVTA
jgi:hypothetical protein